jgi:hypothetical protein
MKNINKIFKKLFLTSALFSLSSAGLVLAMDQNPNGKPNTLQTNSPSNVNQTPNTLKPLSLREYLKNKKAAYKATHSISQIKPFNGEPPKIFFSPSSNNSKLSSSSAQPQQIQNQSTQGIQINLNQNQIQKLLYQIARKIYADPNTFYLKLYFDWEFDKKIDFSNHNFKNNNEFEDVFLSLKFIWHQIKNLNLENCNLTELPAEINATNLPNLERLNLGGTKLEVQEKDIIKNAFMDKNKTQIVF